MKSTDNKQGEEMSLNVDERLTARSNITVQVIGEEVMLHDGDNDTIHVLNHSAYAVWKLCDGENTFEEILKKLAVQYPDAGPGFADDIREIIQDFSQKMLLVKERV